MKKTDYFFLFRPITQRLDQIFRQLRRNKVSITIMTNELLALKTQVEQTVALQAQVVTKLNELVQRLSPVDSPQDMLDIKAQLQASTEALAVALGSAVGPQNP